MRSITETRQLIQRAQSGDSAARELLVQDNMGLVHSSAARFRGRGTDYEDLCQIGTIGLLQAIDRFDTSLDYRFSTYAVPVILGELKRFLRDDGMIKVSRSLKETAQKVRVAKEALEKELGREPRMTEIARRVGVSSEEVVLSMEATQPTQSLHMTVGDGEHRETYLLDRIMVQGDDSDALVDRIALVEAIDSFPKEEKKLIMLRFFKQKTQMEVARQLGISQVSVSRLEKKILSKLRSKILKGEEEL